jgi:hypothetical protein
MLSYYCFCGGDDDVDIGRLLCCMGRLIPVQFLAIIKLMLYELPNVIELALHLVVVFATVGASVVESGTCTAKPIDM